MKSEAGRIPSWFWDRSDSGYLAGKLNITQNQYYIDLLSQSNYILCYINLELESLHRLLGLNEETDVVNEINNILIFPGIETGEIWFIRDNITGGYLDWGIQLVEYKYE